MAEFPGRRPNLHAAFAAAVLAGAFAFPATAMASTYHCPSGQIYRVSKKTCESRAGNEQFIRHAQRAKHAAPRTRTASRAETDAAPRARPQAISPFGALAGPSLKCEPRAGAKCTPAKLFNLE